MNAKQYKAIISLVLALHASSFCLQAQEQVQPKPFSVEFYPSVHVMYGLLFYELESGDKNASTYKYYNQNYNIGLQANADLKLVKDLRIQLYIGYNRWNQADLFPVGVMIKPKLNKKINEFYLKLGGGYSFGKRYDDPHERWLASSMPKDYGKGNIHGQLGIEKNWHFTEKSAISVGFLMQLQLIKSYTTEFSYGGERKLFPYYIPYKFAGVTIAYHFY